MATDRFGQPIITRDVTMSPTGGTGVRPTYRAAPLIPGMGSTSGGINWNQGGGPTPAPPGPGRDRFGQPIIGRAVTGQPGRWSSALAQRYPSFAAAHRATGVPSFGVGALTRSQQGMQQTGLNSLLRQLLGRGGGY